MAQAPISLRRIGANEFSDLALVEGRHTSRARYALDVSGRRWVAKHVSDCGHEALLGEALGWLLSRHIRVPLPDACVAGTGTDASWLSECIDSVVHWSPDLGDRLQNAEALGRALALDAVLHNPDRHGGNILLEPLPRGPNLRAWAIDFDASLVGWPGDYARLEDMALPSLKVLARGLPVRVMRAGARDAAREVTLIPAQVLTQYVREACDIAGESNADLLVEAVQARTRRAVDLTDRYLRTIEELP